MFAKFIISLAGIAISTGIAFADTATDKRAKVTVVFDRELPNAPGMSMKGVLVEYQPGGSSPAHTHPATAFIYATVLEGAIRSKVNDGPETVFKVGESWAEVPGDHHAVSANASETEPAKLLAVFVVKTDETNLVTEDPK